MESQARKWPRWRWIAVAVLGCFALVAAGWFFRGRGFWTDGRAIAIDKSEARIREVLWTPPADLGEHFNTAEQEYEPSVSFDGSELFFVRGKPGSNADIFISHRHNDAWSKPAPLKDVNGPDDELGPRLTPDGKFLLFYSNRAGGLGQYDVWAAERMGRGFMAPFNLGPDVNSQFSECNPAPTPDGKQIYFSSNRQQAAQQDPQAWRATIRESATGDYDLFVSSLVEQKTPATRPSTRPGSPLLVYGQPGEVAALNTKYNEGASCISPLGDFIYFASDRPGGSGKFDIYRARIRPGEIEPPENLGAQINTTANEADPQLAVGGFQLYFSSDRRTAADNYDLLTSESREVYAARHARPLPALGWSWWILLAASILLVPLMLSLRGWNTGRFNLLQKCLLISVLVHVLLTICLSLVSVSQQVVEYVKQQGEMQIRVNLNGSPELAVTTKIREQISNTPIETPEPAQTAQRAIPAEEIAPTQAMAVNVPSPRGAPPPMTIAVAPRSAKPAPVQPLATAAPEVPFEVPQPAIETKKPIAVVERSLPMPRERMASIARQSTRSDQFVPAAGEIKAAMPSLRPTAAPINPAPPAAGGHASMIAALSVQPNVEKSVDVPDIAPPAQTARLAQEIQGSDGAGDAKIPAVGRVRVASGLQAVKFAPNVMPGQVLSAQAKPGGSLLAAATPTTRPAFADSVDLPVTANVSSKLELAVPQIGARVAAAAQVAEISGSEQAVEPQKQVAETAGLEGDGADAELASAVIPAAGADSTGGSLALASAAPARSVDMSALIKSEPPISGPQRIASDIHADENLAQIGGRNGEADAAANLEAVAGVAQRTEVPLESTGPQGVAMGGAPTGRPGPPASPAEGIAGAAVTPRTGGVVQIQPELTIAVASPQLSAPENMFQRSVQQRRPIIEKLGGSKESEEAVDRALAYLARNQEPDGRWGLVIDATPPGSRAPHTSDGAVTGLAILAFLAADHTPATTGPYREVVDRGLELLLSRQKPDGDLREVCPGVVGAMYNQGICTMALAEAALMTGDPRYTKAAIKGTEFICAAQNKDTGGWRYAPGDTGDTSVFGWQIMALHSVEQLGHKIPDETRARAAKYVELASQGALKSLGSYTPGIAPTQSMTGELLFSRILLGQKLTAEQEKEASTFLIQSLPAAEGAADFYGWYYVSLALDQLQNDEWKKWNTAMRDSLIKRQTKGGAGDGCWEGTITWMEHGGKIYTTSMGALTLEVYYRYLNLLDTPKSQ